MSGPAARAELWRVRGIDRTPRGVLIGYGDLELEVEVGDEYIMQCLEFWLDGQRVADWVTQSVESTIQHTLDNLTAHERIRLIRSFHVHHPWLSHP